MISENCEYRSINSDHSVDCDSDKSTGNPKLSSLKAGFMICKGYFVAAILFVPHQVLLSGWLFTLIALLISLVINIYSCVLLSEVNDAVEGSFPQIAQILYGTRMRHFTEFTVITS